MWISEEREFQEQGTQMLLDDNMQIMFLEQIGILTCTE